MSLPERGAGRRALLGESEQGRRTPLGENGRGRRTLLGAVGALTAVTAAATLAGCGFRLRQPPPLEFRSIALAGFAPRSPMALALQRSLAQTVQVVASPALAEVVLQALVDTRERSVVASTSFAQVREIQLRVGLSFRAQTPQGRELLPLAELLLSRDLSYTESAALAKELEEAEMFRDMQADVVAQVLRRLAAVRL